MHIGFNVTSKVSYIRTAMKEIRWIFNLNAALIQILNPRCPSCGIIYNWNLNTAIKSSCV